MTPPTEDRVQHQQGIPMTAPKNSPVAVSKTDCREDDGITVGLIDSLISICRALAPRIRQYEEKTPAMHVEHVITEATKDLWQDEDLRFILGHPERWVAVLRRTYPDFEWPGPCQKFVPPRGFPSRKCNVSHDPWLPCPKGEESI